MVAVPKQLLVTGPAKDDIRAIIRWSLKEFGAAAALRYSDLIEQAVRNLRDDPMRPGAKERAELGNGVRTYHLKFSRNHVAGDRVKEPRHLLAYRIRKDDVIEVVRLLHDSRELVRHLPEEYRLDK